MSEDVKLDIEKVLEEASEPEEEESSTEPEGQEEEEEKPSKSKEASKRGKGASNRIQELVAEKKALEEEFEKAKSTLSERDAELGKLVDLLQARDNDAQVVAKINELYQKEEYKPFIEYLDKLVRGEEVEEKPNFSTKQVEKDTDKSAELLRKLDEKAAEIDDALADREADLILKHADSMVSDWMKELPKEYGPEDKKIISELIIDRVDWDSIEEAQGSNLEEELVKGWNETVEYYGRPRGLAVENTETKEKEIDPEEEIQKLRTYANQDWGRMKSVESGNMKIIKPEVSEEDFSKAFAEILRKGRSLGV